MKVTLHIDGKAVTLERVTRKEGQVSFVLGGTSYSFSGNRLSAGMLVLMRVRENGVNERHSAAIWQSGKLARVQVGGSEAGIAEQQPTASSTMDAPLSPLAPMPGLVRQVLVKATDQVKKGQTLVVMEAMKLHTALTAGGEAIVEKVLVKEGELVKEGAELVRLKPLEPV